MPAWFFEKAECGWCKRPDVKSSELIHNSKGLYICHDCIVSLARGLSTRPYTLASLRSSLHALDEPPVIPTLDDLERAVVIGQTVAHSGVSAKLHALELYADGFVVSGRVRPTQPSESDERVHWSFILDPASALTVDDGLGGRYVSAGTSGNGNSGEWHFRQAFGPALNPVASELRVEIANLRWVRFDLRTPEDRNQDVLIEGPWTFVVPLTPDR